MTNQRSEGRHAISELLEAVVRVHEETAAVVRRLKVAVVVLVSS